MAVLVIRRRGAHADAEFFEEATGDPLLGLAGRPTAMVGEVGR